jgi:hypothetical protein
MNVGKSGKFQEYFIKIPGVFQEFPGPGKLENQIPGLSRSCTMFQWMGSKNPNVSGDGVIMTDPVPILYKNVNP